MDDGLLEVVGVTGVMHMVSMGVTGVMHMGEGRGGPRCCRPVLRRLAHPPPQGQVQGGLRSGIRIAQGAYFRVTLLKATPVQVDGEPWVQAPGHMIISAVGPKVSRGGTGWAGRRGRRARGPGGARRPLRAPASLDTSPWRGVCWAVEGLEPQPHRPHHVAPLLALL